MKLKGKTSSLVKKTKQDTYADPQRELEPFSPTRFSFPALSSAWRGGIFLEGLTLCLVAPALTPSTSAAGLSKGARLAGSNHLAKGQRAGSGEAKKTAAEAVDAPLRSWPVFWRGRGLSRAQP